MSGPRVQAGRANGRRYAAFALAAVLLVMGPGRLGAQEEPEPRRIHAIEATPAGALPPLALPMPASRNHNYWAFRLQAGTRVAREGGPDLAAVAGGVDLQWRGGSTFGVTGGYQFSDCESGAGACDGHLLFGARARFNVITGGPTIASVFGDYSATSTLGAEVGFGWAPDSDPDSDACTLDVGMPLSVAMLQTVRLVAFVIPAGSFDVNCGSGSDRERDFIVSAGVGLQQLLLRGLDVSIGFQRIVRDDTGYQFGISLMYVHLP